jgi:hypothetical protein
MVTFGYLVVPELGEACHPTKGWKLHQCEQDEASGGIRVSGGVRTWGGLPTANLVEADKRMRGTSRNSVMDNRIVCRGHC